MNQKEQDADVDDEDDCFDMQRKVVGHWWRMMLKPKGFIWICVGMVLVLGQVETCLFCQCLKFSKGTS